MSEDTCTYDDLEVLDGFILFEFEQEVDPSRHNAFTDTSKGGIILPSDPLTAGKYARWGVVTAVGEGVDKDITVGTRILIEPLKWTKISSYKGLRFARTESKYVLAIGE